MILKIALCVLAAAFAYATALLDYMCHDKRTRIFKRLRWILLAVVLPVFSLGSGVSLVNDEKGHDREVAALNGKLRSIEDGARSEATRAEQRDNDRSERLANLKADYDKLNDRLDPFVAIAMQRYPGSSKDDALGRLSQDVASIRTVAERADSRSAAVSSENSTVGVTRLARILSIVESQAAVDGVRHANVGSPCYASVGSLNNNGDSGTLHTSLMQTLRAAGWRLDPGEYIMAAVLWQDIDLNISRSAPRRCVSAIDALFRKAGLKVEHHLRGPIGQIQQIGVDIRIGLLR